MLDDAHIREHTRSAVDSTRLHSTLEKANTLSGRYRTGEGFEQLEPHQRRVLVA
jgi:hypothetical protein